MVGATLMQQLIDSGWLGRQVFGAVLSLCVSCFCHECTVTGVAMAVLCCRTQLTTWHLLVEVHHAAVLMCSQCRHCLLVNTNMFWIWLKRRSGCTAGLHCWIVIAVHAVRLLCRCRFDAQPPSSTSWVTNSVLVSNQPEVRCDASGH
jgi:hypothetical protein